MVNIYSPGNSITNSAYLAGQPALGRGANSAGNRQQALGWYGDGTTTNQRNQLSDMYRQDNRNRTGDGSRQPDEAANAAAGRAQIGTGRMALNTAGQPVIGAMGGVGAPAAGGGAAATVGAAANGGNPNGAYTTSIDANPIWDKNAIQGQVNQANAGIQNQSQNQGQQLSQNLAGRGFGATGGGLGAALRAALGSNTAAQQAQSEQGIRFGADQANAQHLLAAQGARANEGLGLGGLLLNQRGQDISADNAARQNILNMLMSTMGGMA